MERGEVVDEWIELIKLAMEKGATPVEVKEILEKLKGDEEHEK